MESLRPIDDRQLAVLGEPHRLAVLKRLMAGPSTLSRLGEAFGRHPAWVRHHLKRLEAAGLVEPAEKRTTRNYTEKFYRATAPAYSSHVLVAPDPGGARPVIALGSHDLALEALAMLVEASGGHIVPAAVGSLDGLIALRQGLADIAGCHLYDFDDGSFNRSYVRHLFPDRSIAMVTMAEREQGLIVAPGNPFGLVGVEDLVAKDVTVVNRNRGSGTRLWLDTHLRRMGAEPVHIEGYEREVSTHTAAAYEVASGAADAGLGIRAAAEGAGLGFVPLFMERYDLVVFEERLGEPVLAAVFETLVGARFRAAVADLGGYDMTCTGKEWHLAA